MQHQVDGPQAHVLRERQAAGSSAPGSAASLLAHGRGAGVTRSWRLSSPLPDILLICREMKGQHSGLNPES